MAWLRWPLHPLRFTVEWDLLEAAFVLLAAVLLLLAAVVAFRRVRGLLAKAWVVCLVTTGAMLAHEWADTMCFARVRSPPDISVVDELPAAEFTRLWQYKQAGLPVVVRGVLNQSVRLDRWSPDRLAQDTGDAVIEVQLGNVEQNSTELFTLPFREFLAGIQSEEWLAQHERHGGKLPYFAESEDLFDHPALALAARQLLRATNLDSAGAFHFQTLFWIGPAGAVTGMHMDMDALNLLFQLNGTKRLWVYPISQSPLVYPSTKYDLGASLAEVDHFQPNFSKYPLFAQAQPLEIVAYPGDVVYIPSGWYHAARSDTVSVSVSVRLFTLCEALAVAPLTLLDILHNMGWYRHSDCVCHNPADGAY